MFNFFKSAQKISDLTTQKALLEAKVANLTAKVDELKNKEDTTQQDFSIDFSKLDAFSIERNGDKHEPCTIIGHFLTNADGTKNVAEWYLYCSIKTHARLVKEFNESKGTNGTK